MSTTGVVTVWHQAEGWGIVESPSLPGAASADVFGIRGEAVADHSVGPLLGLRPGTEVEFEYSRAESPVNGCDFLIHSVWPVGVTPRKRSPSPYSGALWNSVGKAGPDGLTTMREAVIDDSQVPRVEKPSLPSTVGTVRVWHSEDGWGVLDSEATPGGAWAHFSEVVGDGFRSLTPGQEVEFEYEERAVDEYPYRANNIRGR
ncbi:cold-shock protein [Gordonia polyisoprenivorans]|uniref:cold-shock protein n=1 Tax=Gordonia polyisoprenivorans TaxID=84595 RepID=UPI00054E4408|nr:cold shock domain-containing protein [Gordonia polyisoprenivorans]OZC33330.1 cold-shock protein [Gordonia polyisoprenivorans]UZF56748.1 cold shock domain-containing protein [Gordonia polyisoprenivorans]